MKAFRMRQTPLILTATSVAILIGLFQNCSPVNFAHSDAKALAAADTPLDPPADPPGGDLDVCDKVSCDLDPLTHKAAVTTILLALGDEAENQLVVNGASAQLIAETVVRYTSPKAMPRILLIEDRAAQIEDPEDTKYVAQVLLKRYDVTHLRETENGISDRDVEGFDVIWLNNPGQRMNSLATRDVLLRFKGGVIIQGDDMSRPIDDHSLTPLTGLKHIDNGTVVSCGGETYKHDNNGNHQFSVTLNPEKIPGADASTISFKYGNDIDNTQVARSDLEILAYAVGGHETCTEKRPAIVRYLKD